MDFFARQDQAHHQTNVLIGYFILAVIAIIASVYLAVMFILVSSNNGPSVSDEPLLWNPEIFLQTSFVVLAIIISGTIYKIIVLQGGGAKIAEMLGGTLIQRNTSNLAEKRLLNVVEEMAIAAGLPVPPVYVMYNEKGINAFAAGLTPDTAVIAVTRGTLELLNRDELQGVIGHEFSHILNGDMRLNLKLVGFLNGILVIAIIGRIIMQGFGRSSRTHSSSNSKSSGGGLMIFALCLMAIGYIGVLFGNLIKAAVSRQREYLADASAIQFTRNPAGLAGALKKIGGLSGGSRIKSSRADEASHMYFSNGLGNTFMDALATHPKLEERIRRIDPQFNGILAKQTYEQFKETAKLAGISSLTGSQTDIGQNVALVEDIGNNPEKVLATIGNIMQAHLQTASRVLSLLPDKLLDAAHDAFGARAVIYCLLLDKDSEISTIQIRHLQKAADKAVFEETLKLYAFTNNLPREARIPLVDLTIPTLRTLSSEQASQFKDNVNRLIEADRQTNIFEYSLRHILFKHLAADNSRKTQRTNSSLPTGPVSIVLSALANFGHRNQRAAAQAFNAAIGYFEDKYINRFAFLALDQVSWADFDNALAALADTTPTIKRAMMGSCLLCLGHDQKVTSQEAELFRVIGDALGCPVPLFIDTLASNSRAYD